MAVAFNDAIAGVVTGLTLDPESQAEAVKQLAEIIDEAEGERAQAVGAAIRDFGCLAPLIEMLSREETQQDALRVIGNLASEAVDARAEETKTLLRELNGFDAVLPLIFSSSEPTLVYALGAVQNLCTRPEYAEHVRATGADAKLRVLETQGRTDILRHFAAGCLANMRAVEAPAYVLPAIGEASASEENGSDDSGEAGHASRAGSSRRSSGAPSPHSRPTAPVPAPPARAVATAGALIRKLVPPDNHCLFTACAYLCEGITRPDALRVAAQRLRGVCARAVEEAADRADRLALLGFESAEAYSEWIRDEGHWGGEPELVALAAHFGVEIVVASCQSLSLLKYGDASPKGTVYMLYTGQHYDPLAAPPAAAAGGKGGGKGGRKGGSAALAESDIRLFAVAADFTPKPRLARERAALDLAREHNECAARKAKVRSTPAGLLPTDLKGLSIKE